MRFPKTISDAKSAETCDVLKFAAGFKEKELGEQKSIFQDCKDRKIRGMSKEDEEEKSEVEEGGGGSEGEMTGCKPQSVCMIDRFRPCST